MNEKKQGELRDHKKNRINRGLRIKQALYLPV